MATNILSNCHFDLTKIRKLYLGTSLSITGGIINFPLDYNTVLNSKDSIIEYTSWTSTNIITIGSQSIQFHEVLWLGENITFIENLIIDQRGRNYEKTLSFELPGIDQNLVDDLELYSITKDGKLTTTPTVAILIDENEQYLIVGYDFPLRLDSISNSIDEENNNIVITYKSQSVSRSRTISSGTLTISPSATPSNTISPSRTPSISRTPSLSISRTRTPSRTPSLTPSLSISATQTPSPSLTPTLIPTATITPTSPTPTLSYVYIDINNDTNLAYTSAIKEVRIGTYVVTDGDWPYNPGDIDTVQSPLGPGTYTLYIDLTGTTEDENYLKVTDSNGSNTCWNITSSISGTTITYTGITMNGTTNTTILYNDGMCIPDPSKTPTPTATITPTPSPEAITLTIDNGSAENTITNITIGGLNVWNVSPPFPIEAESYATCRSPLATGIHTIVFSLGGTSTVPKYAILTDSNNYSECQEVGTSDTTITFENMVVNTTGLSFVLGASGTCPSPSPSQSLPNTPSRTPTPTPSRTPTITPSPTTYYYVTKSGVDDAGRDGSISEPWATLSYACTRVTSAGSTIYIGSGNYTDNSRCNVSPGVSILGNSSSPPTITTSYAATSSGNAFIYLVSSSLTDGNQSISWINLDGNFTSYRAILVWRRNNVIIHDCEIVDFKATGIHYRNQIDWKTPPTTYATGNTVYNCVITDCSDRTYASYDPGNLRMDGQQDMDVYGCTFRNDGKSAGTNGNTINLTNDKGITIHDCDFIKNDTDGSNWNFYSEIFHCHGGVEIYDCTFTGAAVLDFSNAYDGSSEKGDYNFSYSVHDNYFTTSDGNLLADNIPRNQAAIVFEKGYNEYIYVYNNIIVSYQIGVMFACSGNHVQELNHFYIYNNKLQNIGNTSAGGVRRAAGIWIQVEPNSYPVYIDYLYIWNNTIYGGGGIYNDGIYSSLDGDMTHWYINNNIIQNFADYGIYIREQAGQTATITTADITYNCTYDNDGGTIYVSGDLTLSDVDSSTGNVTGNPLLTSSTDFHLSSTGSTAYHSGIDVGLSTDLDGNLWNDPPSMGCYEYGSAPPETSPSPTPSLSITATRTPSLSISSSLGASPSLSTTPTATITPTPSPEVATTPTPTPSSGSQPCASGVMGYWKLDESSGTNVNDSSPNGLDGTSANISFISGQIGNAYSFNGSSSYVQIGAYCRPTSGLSVQFWIYGDTAAGTLVAINNAVYSTNWYGWIIFFTSGGYIRFQLADGAGTMTQYTTTTNLRDSDWHHVICTWDDSSNAVVIYVDGSSAKSDSYAASLAYHANCNLHFGSNETHTSQFLNADLDEIGIWNRALTSAEVAYLYNGGTGRSCFTETPTSPTPSLSITATRTPSLSITRTPGAPSLTPSVSPSQAPISFDVCTFPTYPSSFDCCSDSPATDSTLYLPPGDSSPSINDYIYTSTSLTDKYVGNSGYYYFVKGTDHWAVQINSSGLVTDVADCNVEPTPSRTPTRTPSLSISRTRTPSCTPSRTPTRTPSISISKTPTRTPTLSISKTPSTDNYVVDTYTCDGTSCGTYQGRVNIKPSTYLQNEKWYILSTDVIIYIVSTTTSNGISVTVTQGPYTSCDDACSHLAT